MVEQIANQAGDGRHVVDKRRLQGVPGRHRVIGTGTKEFPVKIVIHYGQDERDRESLREARHRDSQPT